MKTNDRFLIGIIGGIALIVVAAFAVALMRPQPEYRPETGPEEVAYNYLLALQLNDLARAYGYLDPDLAGFPRTIENFTTDLSRYTNSLDANRGSVSLEVLSSSITGDRASISVRENRFSQGGLLSSGQSSFNFNIQMRRADPDSPWKVTGSDQYWAWCWNDEEGCRQP
jgi:hypothetical protein